MSNCGVGLQVASVQQSVAAVERVEKVFRKGRCLDDSAVDLHGSPAHCAFEALNFNYIQQGIEYVVEKTQSVLLN